MPSERDQIAAALPNYELGELIGRGSFGVVFGAHHRSLDRAVAVKVLEQGNNGDDARTRFINEAKLIASLSHPHIVPVHDFVVTDERCLLVMERLDQTLTEHFSGRGVATDEACAIALAASAALQAAHERGVLHRDVKPDNLLVSRQGQLKLSDFGLAKLHDADSRLTQEGVILGTPAYMAPEQALGQELSPATDIYSLAVVLYELLSGAVPFEHATGERSQVGSLAMLLRHVNEQPRPLGDVAPNVAPEIVAVVERALQRSPSDRYPSAEDFGVALASAAAHAFGAGWLARSGIPVMGSAAITAAAETTAPATSTALITPVGASIKTTPGTEVLSAAELAALSTAPTPSSRAKARRLPLIVAAVVAAVAIGVGVAIVAAGGGDSDGTTASDAPAVATSLAAIAPPTSYRAFEKEFIDICLGRPTIVGNVKDPTLRCVCVFDLATASIPVSQEALDQFRNSTTITPAMARFVLTCQTNGK